MRHEAGSITRQRDMGARVRARGGMSLIEMVLSLAILALIMGAMTSFVLVATRALPMQDSPMAARAKIQDFMRQIGEDARSARKVMLPNGARESDTTYTLVDRPGVVFEVPDRNKDGFNDFVWIAREETRLVRRIMLSMGEAIPSDRTGPLRSWLSLHFPGSPGAGAPSFRDAGMLEIGTEEGNARVELDLSGAGKSIDTTPGLTTEDVVDDTSASSMRHLLSFARGGASETIARGERLLHIGPTSVNSRPTKVLIALMPAAPVPLVVGEAQMKWRPTRVKLYVKRTWVDVAGSPQTCSARYSVAAYRMPVRRVLDGGFAIASEEQVSRAVVLANCELLCNDNAYAVQAVDLDFSLGVSATNTPTACTANGLPYQSVAPLRPGAAQAFASLPSTANWLQPDECLVLEVRLPRAGDAGFVASGGAPGCSPAWSDAEPGIALLASAGSGSESCMVLQPDGSGAWEPAPVGVAFDLWGETTQKVTQTRDAISADTDVLARLTIATKAVLPGGEVQEFTTSTRPTGAMVDLGE